MNDTRTAHETLFGVYIVEQIGNMLGDSIRSNLAGKNVYSFGSEFSESGSTGFAVSRLLDYSKTEYKVDDPTDRFRIRTVLTLHLKLIGKAVS